MVLIIGLYLVVGGVSALTNFGKWIFSSWLVGIIFLPFMITSFLIYGDEKKRSEAIIILKGLFILTILYIVLVGILYVLKE
jgi:hypothetical protein